MKPQASPPPTSDIDMQKLRQAWRLLLSYRPLSLHTLDLQALSYSHLEESAQELVSMVPIRLSHMAEAVERNADVLQQVAQLTGFGNSLELKEVDGVEIGEVVDGILMIARDWSEEGEKERMLTYGRIVKEVDKLTDKKEEFRVLVPGAGVGRLAWELAREGYEVLGLERSHIMMLLCKYVLNGAASNDAPLHMFPLVHEGEAGRGIEVPDVDLREALHGHLGMKVGGIEETEGGWDCVASCFWLGNVHSPISCIRKVAQILQVGGAWINVGVPGGLGDSEVCVEITQEEIELVMQRVGLKIVKKEDIRVKPPLGVGGGGVLEVVDAVLTVAIKE